MNPVIRAKLSFMMFLEYVIYGAWLPLLNVYLGKDYLNFTLDQQGWVFNAFALASLTGMFFGGQLADRYFAQEKFLAFSHLIGGLAMLGLAYQKTFWPFFGLMLLHCFFYVPTISMTNAIAFANIKDAQKDFGFIRVWGTFGWIAAAWPLIFIPIDWASVPAQGQGESWVAWLGKALGTLKTGPAMEAALAWTFTVAGIASLGLAAFCLFLPHTPPSKGSGASFVPFKAFKPAGSAQYRGALFRDFPRLAGALRSFFLDRALPDRPGAGDELGLTCHEHRPGRRAGDDGRSRARTQTISGGAR